MDIIIDERLVERGVGTIESKDSKIYKNNNYYDVKLNSDEYGVESVKDLFAKVSSFLEDIKEKFLDKTTCCNY